MKDILRALFGLFPISLTKVSDRCQSGELFGRFTHAKQTPVLNDGKIAWLCTCEDSEDSGKLRGGSSYGFLARDGRLFVTEYGKAGTVELKAINNALVAEDRDSQSTLWVAFRAIDTPKGRRLLMEDSGDVPSWQGELKSKITGFTPKLYSICIPANEILGK